MKCTTPPLIVVAFATPVLLLGCAVIETIDYQPIEHAVQKQLGLEVLLRLDAKFAESKWQEERLGREHTMILGPALSQHATALAQALFTTVRIDPEASVESGFDATLTAKLVAVARSQGTNERTTLLLEWTMTDPQNRPVWVQTISGTGEGGLSDLQPQGVAALNQLFERSREAMASAVEIRRLARVN